MGWLRAAGRWISNAANDVAEFVEDLVNDAVELVSDLIETVGSLIQDAFEWIGDIVGRIPVIGRYLEAFFDWIGDSLSWVFRLLATIVKGVGSIVGGLLAGVIRIVGGILSLNGRLILKGLWDIASGVLGAIFVIFPTLLGLLQTLTWTQARSRRLNEKEMAILRRVYGESIAFPNVRIVLGFAGVLSLDSAAIVFGNTIYFKNRVPVESISLFVHEACHVWQYQHIGSRYASDALSAQILIDDEYDWEKEVAEGAASWNNLNREAQAEIFMDVWAQGQLITNSVLSDRGNGVFYDATGMSKVSLMVVPATDGIDHTALCDEAVVIVRAAPSRRPSAWFS